MYAKTIICLMAAVLAVGLMHPKAQAAQVDSDQVYCFSTEDFSQQEQLTGICILGLPDASTGTVMLGSRVVRSGDILTAAQIDQMTFAPIQTEADATATVTFLPIYENRVERSETMTISVRGKKDQSPVAEDSMVETYKNLPNGGKLKVSDPEGMALQITITRQPKRGTLQVEEDGSFTYTPKKNKVGVDSFTYTATDPAGNVSREATVTIRVLKPAVATQYADTEGTQHRFAAEWMKNTGLFIGEQVGEDLCFNAEQTVSRGQFLAMMLQTLEIPVDSQQTFTGYVDHIPQWLKPYLAAALRCGLTAGLPSSETGIFGAQEPVTGGEAAVLLQNALELGVQTSSVDEQMEDAWAQAAVAAMNENGIALTSDQILTRADVAMILYQVSTMCQEAPGLSLYR